MDYANIVFAVVKPPGRIIEFRQFQNKSQHQQFVREVIERGLCLYYAPATKRGNTHYATQPWILDESTIPQITPERKRAIDNKKPIAVPDSPAGFPCPYCKAVPSSNAGRTLHVKSKHSDKLAEFKKLKK